MVDFGLSKIYVDENGENFADSYVQQQFLGTPKYISVYIHQGHSPSLRDDILISNPSDRKYYTRQELELTSGQPFKDGDQDKLDELLTITDEELEFWNKIGVSPTYMFEDYGIDDEFSYDVKIQRTVTQ